MYSSSKVIDDKRRYSFNILIDGIVCHTTEYFRYLEFYKSVQKLPHIEHSFPAGGLMSKLTDYEASQVNADQRGNDLSKYFNRVMNNKIQLYNPKLMSALGLPQVGEVYTPILSIDESRRVAIENGKRIKQERLQAIKTHEMECFRYAQDFNLPTPESNSEPYHD